MWPIATDVSRSMVCVSVLCGLVFYSRYTVLAVTPG